MTSDWFFLSYARHDRDDDPFECIRKFYADLDREIARLKVIKSGHAGFYDGTGLQQGTDWPQGLAAALNTCRVMICLYSPAYFDSEFCGREFAVFTARHAALPAAEAGATRRFVLPVLLEAPQELGRLPDAVADIQFVDDDYPEVYRQEGLRYLFRRTSNELKDRYQDFLDALVGKVLTAATEVPALPSLGTVPSLLEAHSAFHAPIVVSPSATSSSEAGPRYAEFIYVAGTRAEIEPLGRAVDNYGEEGELDWKPYLPETPDEVGLIAQTVATTEKFRYRVIPLGPDLLDSITRAEASNRVVIIIVDTWTLRLQKYSQWMQNYDRVNFDNCAVLIVWNDNDADTLRNRGVLENGLRRSFLHKTRAKDPNSFVDSIGTAADLVRLLSIALQKTSAQIVDNNNLRRIESALTKPEVSGPGTRR